MKDAAKHTRNLNTCMKLICSGFILEILEILMMFRTIRHPNNMYAVNNEGGHLFYIFKTKTYSFPERKGSADNEYPHPPPPLPQLYLGTILGRLFLFLSAQPTIK